MPIIIIPKEAKRKYIEFCRLAKEAELEHTFDAYCNKARIYGDAIKDICGLSVWGEIVRCADMEIGSDEYPVCCGIPLLFKPFVPAKQD